MKRIKHSLLFLYIFICSSLNAQSIETKLAESANAFIENKGQIIDQYNNPNSNVYFVAALSGMNVQLRKNGFSYDTYKTEDTYHDDSSGLSKSFERNEDYQKDQTLYFHRIDIEFLETNPNVEIQKSDICEDVCNYYTTSTAEKGIIGVRKFRKVIYKNMYPAIDIEFIIADNEFKFNFILHQGADINSIKWLYRGANGSFIKEGKIIIETRNGILEERIPISYYNEDKTQKLTIEYQNLSKNIFGFQSKMEIKLLKEQTLTIDPIPILLWSTYFGGIQENLINASCIDSGNYLYIGGTTTSTTNIATTGSFQSVKAAGNDAFIAKFDKNGNRIWSTYYGYSGYESINDMGISFNNYLYVSGTSTSASGMATSGAFQSSMAGSADIIISKFSLNGIRVWGTYYGEAFSESDAHLALSNTAVYICATTESDGPYLSTPRAYQIGVAANNGSGIRRGLLASFNFNGNRIWSTLIRTSDQHYANLIEVDKYENIIVGGYTRGQDSIATAGTFQTITVNSDHIGWFMKFTKNGQKVWGTYYGGTASSGSNVCYPNALLIDTNQNIYIAGATKASTNISSQNAFKTTITGTNDAFIAKLDSNANRIWGTYYGGSKLESFKDLCLNSFGDLIVGGTSNSNNGIITANALSSVSDTVNSNLIITKWDTSGQRIWGSYFGGTNAEDLYRVEMDKLGKFYILGVTKSTSGISTAGAFSTTHPSNGLYYTGYIARLTDCVEPDSIHITLMQDSLCYGQTATIQIQGNKNGASHWAVYSDNILLDTTSLNIFSFTSSNTSNIIVKGAGGCVIESKGDTVKLFVKAPEIYLPNDTSICKGDSVFLLGSTNGIIGSWINANNNSYVKPNTSSQYIFTATDSNLCVKSDTFKVVVNNLPLVDAGSDTSICIGDSILLQAKGTAQQYFWQDTISDNTYLHPLAGINLILKGIDSNYCVNKDTVSVFVNSLPPSYFTCPFHQKCFDHPGDLLSGGLPPGGIYSGIAVELGYFFPYNAQSGWNLLTYTYTDINGCSSSAIDSVFVDSCLSVQNNSKNIEILIFPNPAVNQLFVEKLSSQFTDINLKIINSNAQIVLETKLVKEYNSIDISKLSSGIYQFIIYDNNTHLKTGTFIKE